MPNLNFRALLAICFVCVSGAIGRFAAAQDLSLSEIVQANEATWGAIFAADVIYNADARHVEKGALISHRSTTGHRWSFVRDRERIRLHDFDNSGRFEDRYTDKEFAKTLLCSETLDVGQLKLTPCDTKGIRAFIEPSLPSVFEKKSPELLRRIGLLGDDLLSLRELAEKWRVTQPVRIDEGDHRQLKLRATYPSSTPTNQWTGSYLDVFVNIDKGFLVERVDAFDTGLARSDETNGSVVVQYIKQVLKFRDCGNGVFFPEVVECRNLGPVGVKRPSSDGFFVTFTATSIDLNESVSPDCLNFKFPENAVVIESLPGRKTGKVYLWGNNNAPAREFASPAAFEAWGMLECKRDSVGAPQPGWPWAVRIPLLAFALGLSWILVSVVQKLRRGH